MYVIEKPIPVIGAHPGDELVIHPTNDEAPVWLMRHVEPEMLAAIPESAVTFVAAYEPDSAVPVDQQPDEAAQPSRRLPEALEQMRSAFIAAGVTADEVSPEYRWLLDSAPRPALRLVP
ncbi:MAG: hypothetical protein ACREX3_00325 [Gammaproteobacteria bacterium]